MGKIELYTFGEAVQMLGISSNGLNDIIMSGRLVPVRHQGRLKFRKLDLERVKVELSAVSLQPPPDSLEKLAASKDAITNNSEHTADLKVEIPAQELLSPALPLTPNKPEQYYSLEQVVSLLQLERAELQGILDQGDLSAVPIEGKIKFKKTEVDIYLNERMLNATLSMHAHIEEEEEIQPIVVISANSDSFSAVVEEFYTLDEAAYELQLDVSELKRMVAHQEIEAVVGKDGQPKFRKADIDSRKPKIEPTLILPDEPEHKEETVFFEGEQIDAKANSSQEKSFYGMSEAAKLLKVSEEQIQRWIQAGQLHPYRYEGQRQLKYSELVKLAQENRLAEAPSPASASASVSSVSENPSITACPPGSAAGAKYYSLDEVKKILNLEEKDIKILVAKGQLPMTRSGKNYLFSEISVQNIKKASTVSAPKEPEKKRCDQEKTASRLNPEPVSKVKGDYPGTTDARASEKDTFKNPTLRKSPDIPLPIAAAPQKAEGQYTLQETMKILGIGKPDVQRLVKNQQLHPIGDNCFAKKEIDQLKTHRGVEVTMVLPLMSKESVAEEEPLGFVASPQPFAPKPPQPPEPEPDMPFKISPPTPRAVSPFQSKVFSPYNPEDKAQEISESEIKKTYYSWKEALLELQMEEENLEELIKNGSLRCQIYQGKKFVKKSEVDTLKKGKMIEPTIMVGDDSGSDILKDDDDDILFQD